MVFGMEKKVAMARQLLVGPAVALLGCMACGQVIEREEFAEATVAGSGALFGEVPRERSGLDMSNDYADPRMWGELFLEFTLGAIGTGVAVGDYDGDGWPDIYVANKTGRDQLYRNLGGMRFEEVGELAGLLEAEGAWTQGVAFVDFDNDGWLDLYVCRFAAPNRLYRNFGNGRFEEVAERAGVAVSDASGMASFEDYDRDGDLDFYLQTNLLSIREGPSGQADYLFRNEGDGTFSDVTREAGISGSGQGHSATWFDYNQDGWPDLYVANDFSPADKLYHNTGGGAFVDALSIVVSRTPNSSMGADVTDLNRDGLIDFMVGDMATRSHEKDMRGMAKGREEASDPVSDPFSAQQYPRNAVYINSGMGPFLEGAELMGLAATDWTWSLRFEDLDGDGWDDLHVTTGMVRELHNTDLMKRVRGARSPAHRVRLLKDRPRLEERNLAFRNLGDFRFEEVGKAWGLDEMGISFGAAFGDFDRDGDLDLVYANYKKGVTLLENRSAPGNRLQIELEGVQSNRFGIGAVVTVEAEGRAQTKVLSLSRGYLSTSEPIVAIGLGEAVQADRVAILWPSGLQQELGPLEAGYRYRAREDGEEAQGGEARDRRVAFVEESRELKLLHRTRESFVFERKDQPFLPMRHNRVGPSLAVDDLDGNGREEVVVGGTPLDPLHIFRRAADGTMGEGVALRARTGRTNDGPILLFDANGDGRSDLLVTAGGVAKDAGNAAYQPVCLLNDDAGGFDPQRQYRLPQFPVSVGAVAATDFDRDGDLDLFLGGRVVPGRFPETPRSALWMNAGDGFDDVTSERAPELAGVGMVTAAVWADVDLDGWPDLVVATDWGRVRCFLNREGASLEEATEELGFDSAGTGWWNSIAVGDFNGDGRMDIALGNAGLNTGYKASETEPATLLYGRFEPGGDPFLIEGKWAAGRLAPRRSWEVLSKRVPGLTERFSGNDAYARASLEEVVGKAFLERAERWEASQLASGVLLSQAGGGYAFHAFPRLMQFAPLQGLVAADFNADGCLDLFASQNDFSPTPSVGRFDGGLGVLALGDGTGGFEALLPVESGILATGDMRAVALWDANGDAAPDLLLSRNHSSVLAYRNEGVGGGQALALRLGGKVGNQRAAGARVELVSASGKSQAREVQLGGGLGQSGPTVFFGVAAGDAPARARVRWPDGSWTEHEWPGGARALELEQPVGGR